MKIRTWLIVGSLLFVFELNGQSEYQNAFLITPVFSYVNNYNKQIDLQEIHADFDLEIAYMLKFKNQFGYNLTFKGQYYDGSVKQTTSYHSIFYRHYSEKLYFFSMEIGTGFFNNFFKNSSTFRDDKVQTYLLGIGLGKSIHLLPRLMLSGSINYENKIWLVSRLPQHEKNQIWNDLVFSLGFNFLFPNKKTPTL